MSKQDEIKVAIELELNQEYSSLLSQALREVASLRVENMVLKQMLLEHTENSTETEEVKE